jgi:hypothetical protein
MKPAKFTRCNIHLPVNDLGKTLAYYKDTLGFTDEWTWGDKDGGLRRDDMRLLFGEDPAYTSTINTATKRLNLLWFVDNIEEIYAEFRERKIPIANELKEYPYGLHEFAFIDINGYYIRVAESKTS